MAIIARDDYWILESGAAAYALGVEESGLLVQTWWGPRLPGPEDYPPARRGGLFAMENAIQHTHQELATGEAGASDERSIDGWSDSGLRGFVLRFVSARVEAESLTLTLGDEGQGVEIELSYRTLDAVGLMSRTVAIRNTGAHTLHVTRLFSGTFYLPGREPYALGHLDGRWGDEFRIEREPFVHGVLQRESRRITTSHGGVPAFAVERDTPGFRAREEAGEVWFGALQWSGNWKLLAERTRDGRAIVHLGLNDHDFALELRPGERFEAPRLVYGYTPAGLGAMSRALHAFVRDELAPRRDYRPPVVYNSWYATLFDVNEAGQSALADRAAAMGVELFVIDDGWFHGRHNDRAGLGDWWPDTGKFPDGLGPLAAAVHRRGMQFGLWIEPEMVNPDSDLYRAHPDWIIHFPERERTLSRNQSMLNLGRRDVQDHLIAVFDRLLAETPIDFVKWDMNRNVSEPGWPGHDRDPRELWVRYVEGLYRLWGELRRRHPGVIWENCSGGGGRVDLGMMALTEQSWTSDNTLPPARLLIQEGYSRLFPAGTMAAWVTDEHKADYSLDFRFHVSMAGALGVGGNLLEWSEAEQQKAAAYIALYKSIRPLVAAGDLYRLASPRTQPLSGLAYVAPDKAEAVVFAFRLEQHRIAANPPLRIAGLDSDAVYAVEVLTPGAAPLAGTMSGRAWAERGIELPLRDLEAVLLRFRRA